LSRNAKILADSSLPLVDVCLPPSLHSTSVACFLQGAMMLVHSAAALQVALAAAAAVDNGDAVAAVSVRAAADIVEAAAEDVLVGQCWMRVRQDSVSPAEDLMLPAEAGLDEVLS
jgi:hypothetical protein